MSKLKNIFLWTESRQKSLQLKPKNINDALIKYTPFLQIFLYICITFCTLKYLPKIILLNLSNDLIKRSKYSLEKSFPLKHKSFLTSRHLLSYFRHQWNLSSTTPKRSIAIAAVRYLLKVLPPLSPFPPFFHPPSPLSNRYPPLPQCFSVFCLFFYCFP